MPNFISITHFIDQIINLFESHNTISVVALISLSVAVYCAIAFIKRRKKEQHENKGFKYGDYINENDVAYNDAIQVIKDKIKSANNNTHIVTIKFIVVGMMYSYTGVTDKIFDLLRSNRSVRFSIQVLMVSPEYLRGLDKEASGCLGEWIGSVVNRISQIVNKINKLSEQEIDRLSIEVKTYDAIPQYHGIIVCDNHLYIGRTSWIFDDDNKIKELRVGKNRYRYFNIEPIEKLNCQEESGERVGLFLSWHKFYWHHFSKTEFKYHNNKKPDVPYVVSKSRQETIEYVTTMLANPSKVD